jgi:membrane protease YdiL (CAAX protease family)
MLIKFTSRQYRNIGIAVAVAAVSLVVVLRFFSRAFPEASIEFRVNRSESERIARQFLEKRGFVLAGYRHAAIFDYDDMAKLYLERTQGLQRMDRLARGPLHLWRWSNRWFKPQHKQEFLVDVTPAGLVVGFDHRIAEAAPGANLAQVEAQRLAETFLTKMGRNLGELQFMVAQQQKRPARTDYTFTWKQTTVNLGEGSLRVTVGVDGNQIASYSEFIKIPEAWTRGYEKIRSHNDAAQEVDQVFWVLLSIAMLVILVRRLRDRDVPLKLALGLGLTAAVLDFLSQVNTFSLAKFSYSTTSSYSSFVSGYVFDAMVSALGMGTLIFLIVASSEPVYRETLPRLMSIRRYFTWEGLRSRSFFMANVTGLSLAAFFFAYQTVFYLVANRLGAWAPSDIPFSNALNTAIPWAAVLFTGFFPAVSEEMQFRAFAIPFLRKLTGSWPLAIVLAAFNWGFLHSAYPNQPFFIRGLEVGIGGIIIGVIMLRFGILATLIWHYSVDALYTAFLLVRSPNHYFRISGGFSAGIMLIPLIVALGAYLVSGTFRDETPITNETEGISRLAASEATSVAEQPAYSSLSRRRLAVAAAVVAVFIAVSFVRVHRIGEGIRIRTTSQGALRSAVQFLAGRHVNLSGYQSVDWLDVNVEPDMLIYLSQRLPIQKVDQITQEITQPLLWEVRFFRPLQEEEYFVFVNPADGRVFDSRHLLSETAPGASLSPQQAEVLAQQAVARRGYNLSGFVLQGVQAIKRKAREDYRLIWQAKPGDPRNIAAARYRLQVDIAGNEIVGFSRYLKLPEQWIRQEESTRVSNFVLLALKVLFGAGLVAGAIWLFVRQVRSGAIQWTASLKVAVLLTVLFILTILNESSLIDRAYTTSISLSNFHLQVAMSFIFLGLALGVLIWLVIALATSLFPVTWQLLRSSSGAVWRRDAAVALLVSLSVGVGMGRLLALLADRFHAEVPPSFPGVGQSFDARSPAFGVLFHALIYSVAGTAVLAIAIYGVRLGWRKRAWWFWAGGILLLLALGPDSAHSMAEYGAGWLIRFIPFLAAVVILILFFRNNPLAYITTAFASVAASSLVDLFSQPAGLYRWNGVLLSVLVAIVLLWLLVPFRKTSKST